MSDTKEKSYKEFKDDYSNAVKKFMQSKEYIDDPEQSILLAIGSILSSYFALVVIYNDGPDGYKRLARSMFECALSGTDENDAELQKAVKRK